jgi:hypothetical protein
MLIRRSITLALIAAFLFMLPLLLRRINAMIDPLLQSGLPVEEIRLYRYLVALQALSSGNTALPTLEVDRIKTFIDAHKDNARVCPVCERYFLENVHYCPYHHLVTLPVNSDHLTRQISEWEAFRKSYVEETRIRGLTRIGAIKLHWIITHQGER